MVLQQSTFFSQLGMDGSVWFRYGQHDLLGLRGLCRHGCGGVRFGQLQKVIATFRLHEGSISGSGRLAERYERERGALRHRYRLPDAATSPLPRAVRQAAFKTRPLTHARGLVATAMDVRGSAGRGT